MPTDYRAGLDNVERPRTDIKDAENPLRMNVLTFLIPALLHWGAIIKNPIAFAALAVKILPLPLTNFAEVE